VIALKALFLGTFNFQTAAVMTGWLAAGHDIAAFWHARGARGRGDTILNYLAPQWSTRAILTDRNITPTPVGPLMNWPGAASAAAEIPADVVISAMFPYLIPPAMLDLFPGRIVNIHPALLPRYRGPAPTAAMVLDRTIATRSGVTLHRVSAGFDEGDIIAQRRVSFPADADMALHRIRVAQAMAAVVRSVPEYLSGRIVPLPQDPALATYERIDRDHDFVLGRHRTVEEAVWLCRTLPHLQPLKVAGGGSAKVAGAVHRLGAPVGRPPVVRPFSVECDLADARVRISRDTALRRKLRGWRFYSMLRRTPVADPDLEAS
jgi:methionyl-tRNA formyltransferase